MSSWPLALPAWRRCCTQPARCRSYSCLFPIRSVLVLSTVWRGRAAMRPGFVQFDYAISGKWLELLKEITPGMTRVAVLRDPGTTAGQGQIGAIQAMAPSFGVEVTPVNVRDSGEIEHAI